MHGDHETGSTAPRLPRMPDLESPPGQGRILILSLLAAVIGLAAGVIAWILYRLIGFFTNLFFFHRLSFQFTSARLNLLGPWEIVVPVIGAIIVGIMAKGGGAGALHLHHFCL